MSLDIYLETKDGEEVAHMGWLRNPFGLIYWIRDNTGVDMWEVINKYSYKQSWRVDREKFLELAEEAWKKVKDLEVGYFRIVDYGHHEFLQKPGVWLKNFSYPNPDDPIMDERLTVSFYLQGKSEYWFEMERYNELMGNLSMQSGSCLASYKGWTSELLEFAVKLQDTNLKYYCSR